MWIVLGGIAAAIVYFIWTVWYGIVFGINRQDIRDPRWKRVTGEDARRLGVQYIVVGLCFGALFLTTFICALQHP